MNRSEPLRALFDELLDVPPAQRAAWLDTQVADAATRAELAALLVADDAARGPLDTPVERYADLLDAGADDDGDPAQGLLGRRFGAFRLVRLLGRGGMATVFLGEREGADFDQRAAVKILHRGLYSEGEQRLFRRERRILARLEHPDIARLIDGGVSNEGVPYLVLEYIDGVPITDYAHRAGLETGARLRLLERLARAVDAAHRALVVHRDLKPGNVLVAADGTLKVLDFGIATLADDEDAGGSTEVARLTPGYAAPEQLVGGTITAATDVHALGVLLRELLTGEAPARTPARAQHAALPLELARIVDVATAAEPQRRYPTAAAFADDIGRYLDGRPVHAHPPSRLYQLRKYVARRRGVVALTAVLAVGLIGTFAAALWQAQVARRQAQAATSEAARANSVRDFIEDLFEPVREGVAAGRMPAITELVAAGRARLDADVRLGLAERVDLTLLFARLNAALGERDRWMELAAHADAQAASGLDRLHPLALAARIAHATSLIRNGDFDAGEPLLLDAQARLAESGAAGQPLIDVLQSRAVMAMDRGEREAALAFERRALAERIRHYGADAEETAAGYNNLGYGLVGVGRHAEAAEAYGKAHAIDSRYRDPGSYDVLNTLANQGWALALGGKPAQAREQLVEVDAGLARLAGKPRGMHVINLQKLCILDVQLARAEGADDCARMLALSAQVAGDDSDTYGDALSFEAARRVGAGDLSGAEQMLAQAWTRFPDVAENARSRARVQRLRAEIAWLSGDAIAARTHALAARPAFERQKDNPSALAVLDGLLLLACTRAPSAQCPSALAADLSRRMATLADAPNLTLAWLALLPVQIERGDRLNALASLTHAETGAAELGVAHPWNRALAIWRIIAAAGANGCIDAAAFDTPGAAGEAQVEPWLGQARAALAKIPACRTSARG
jgi:serine/threonine-protein kinase